MASIYLQTHFGTIRDVNDRAQPSGDLAPDRTPRTRLDKSAIPTAADDQAETSVWLPTAICIALGRRGPARSQYFNRGSSYL